jgi:hypothetical protein
VLCAAGRAKVAEERPHCLGVAVREDVAIVVAGNGNDLAGVTVEGIVGLVELHAIEVFLGAPENDILQMEQKRRRLGGRNVVEVGGHGVGYVPLGRILTAASVANSLKQNASCGSNVGGSLIADDIPECHHTVATGLGDVLQAAGNESDRLTGIFAAKSNRPWSLLNMDERAKRDSCAVPGAAVFVGSM